MLERLLPSRKLLVAIDGSVQSFRASDYAIDFAKIIGAELIVLYVIHQPIYPVYSPYESLISPGSARREEDTPEEGLRLVGKVEERASKNNLAVKTDVIIGATSGATSVVKEIVEYAENNKVDMIVIGSRGMTGFTKMLVGSVASGVVTYSHCPVLVVK